MAKPAKKSGAAAAGIDVADFLIANAGVAGPAAKKGGVPELAGQGKLADRVFRAYTTFKDAEADFRAVEGEALDVTGREYEKRSRAGEHTKSMDLRGLDTPGIQVTYQDKFSALGIEQEKPLRDALGAKFDTYFEQDRKLTIKDECTDNATIKLLIQKLGEAEFRRIFDIKLTVVCKSDMDRKQFEIDSGVRELCGLKQAKASVKVLKG